MKFLSQINVNTEYTLPIVDGTNGQVLATDGNGTAYWGSISAGATNLNALTDVVISSPSTGQILRYGIPVGSEDPNPVWHNWTPNFVTTANAVTITGTQTITGSKTFTAATTMSIASGSDVALTITKGGNHEALYINKTSGSGNAVTVVGTLEATTIVKTGGTASQFLKADGSVDTNTYLTSFTETDPTVPSHVKSISTTDIGNWNIGYNDSIRAIGFSTTTGVLTLTQQDNGTLTVDLDGRYLESYTETDPIYVASTWYDTINNSRDWDDAYSWGNHADVGYLTSLPAHTHAIADVTGLQTALDGKVPTTRTLTINGTAFDLSANRSWTISSADGYISDVRLSESTLEFTGEGSAFNGNVDLSTLPFAASSHTHTIANVTGLQTALDSKLSAEADTLATVVSRGSTTSSTISVVETTGGGFLFRTNSGWGSWARNGFSFANGSGTPMKSLGAYGDTGTSLGYMYLGTDYQTNNIRVYDTHVFIPYLDLAMSNNNGSHGAGTYFRGDSAHFVLGLNNGNTFYLNYGNDAGALRTYGTWYHQDVQILSTSRVLTNVSGNISMFTNDSGYITGSYLDDYTRGAYRVISDYGSNTTWYIRSNGQFVFATGHDWTASFRLNIDNGSGYASNGSWAYFGQQDSNNTNGTWRGVRIRKYAGGSVDGDLSAGAYYIGDTRKDTNWDTAYNDKVNSASFNTTTGVLTLTQQDGGTVTVDLDGRYVTSDSDNQELTWDSGAKTLGITGGNSVVLDLATEEFVTSQGYVTSSGTVAGVLRTVTGTTSAELVRGNMGDNDQARILVGATSSNAGYLEIATADDGTEPIYVRQYTGVFSTLTRTATILDGSGNTSLPGNLTIGGTFTESSSIRFKENITPLDPALDKVNQLEAVSYNKIGVDNREIGLIAEEVAELFPEVVTYDEEGAPMGVQYQRLSVILLKAVQELTERVNKLENK